MNRYPSPKGLKSGKYSSILSVIALTVVVDLASSGITCNYHLR